MTEDYISVKGRSDRSDKSVEERKHTAIYKSSTRKEKDKTGTEIITM